MPFPLLKSRPIRFPSANSIPIEEFSRGPAKRGASRGSVRRSNSPELRPPLRIALWVPEGPNNPRPRRKSGFCANGPTFSKPREGRHKDDCFVPCGTPEQSDRSVQPDSRPALRLCRRSATEEPGMSLREIPDERPSHGSGRRTHEGLPLRAGSLAR